MILDSELPMHLIMIYMQWMEVVLRICSTSRMRITMTKVYAIFTQLCISWFILDTLAKKWVHRPT